MTFHRIWLVYGILAAVIILAGSSQTMKPIHEPQTIWTLDPTTPQKFEPNPITNETTLTLVTHQNQNQTSSPIKIEKSIEGAWKNIPYKPNSNFVQLNLNGDPETINITSLDSGTYRVGRSINARQATIEFQVNRPKQDPDTRPLYGFKPIYFYENWANGLQTLELANMGARTQLVGSGYHLERKTDAGWVTESSVADAGPPLRLESGDIYRQSFQLPMGEGEYRYVKDVGVENSTWIESLTFPYVEEKLPKVYIWDPEPNLRSNVFSAQLNKGPYTPGDKVPFKVEHLGGSDEENPVSFQLELIEAENLMVVSQGTLKSLQTYETGETTISISHDATAGTYYLKLSASTAEGVFSTITQVVQVVDFEKLQLSPEVRITAEAQYRVFTLTIENPCPRSIVLRGFGLEKLVDGAWVSYPLGDAVKNSETTIGEGGFWWWRFDFSRLGVGDYRVVSLISYLGGAPQRFYANFQTQ